MSVTRSARASCSAAESQPIGAELCYSGVYMEVDLADELCTRLAADLDSAFADVVIRHQQLVFGIARRVVGDGASAEDVAQEVFVRAYRTLARYPAERVRELHLRPWLGRMTLNLARNSIRGRRPMIDVDGLADHPHSTKDDPLQRAQRSEERRMWALLLAGLPDRYRLAVALRHVEGLSYAELADTLGRPLGSVKSDVHRGTALLRAAYDAQQRAITHQEAV